MPMSRSSKRVAALVAALTAAGGLAACSSSSSGSSGSSNSTSTAAAPATSGTSSTKPQSGGTLNVVAATGPDHMDPVQAYYTADYELERVYTRQLLAYPTAPYTSTTGTEWTQDVTPVPDIATAVPTAANGGITDGGKVYTFHIKPGVMWGTTPARQVTADDFVREFKAFFNPVSPVGNPGYYSRRSRASRHTRTRRPPSSPTPRRSRRRRLTSRPSRTRTPSPASRPWTAARCSSR